MKFWSLSFTFGATNKYPAVEPQKSRLRGKILVQQPWMRTRKDLVLNLLLTYLCLSVYLFHNKGKREGTIIPPSSYTGWEAESRNLTDVESRLRLNPSCIKPSSLDYPSQPLVTSARVQTWILTVLSVLCVLMLQSARRVVHWTKSRLHLPAGLKRALLTRGNHTRVSPPTEKKNPSTHTVIFKEFFPRHFGALLWANTHISINQSIKRKKKIDKINIMVCGSH